MSLDESPRSGREERLNVRKRARTGRWLFTVGRGKLDEVLSKEGLYLDP
jgi:hypothetical protein